MLSTTTVKILCRQALMISALFAVTACLPSAEVDKPEQASSEGPPPPPPTNSAPTINGNPNGQALPGQTYTFQPTASDPDGDNLTFSVQNLPAWANFTASNGRVSGTPGNGDVATYSGIRITVSDGQSSAMLGPFSITVNAVALGSATLSWTAPTLNTDGSALTDLAGYKLYWGSGSRNYTNSVTLDGPGLSTYVVNNLTAGNWYFAMTAYNQSNVESSYSGEAIKSVQ